MRDGSATPPLAGEDAGLANLRLPLVILLPWHHFYLGITIVLTPLAAAALTF